MRASALQADAGGLDTRIPYHMKTREQAIERVLAMRRTWGMWAMTREAFVAHLGVLVEVFTDVGDHIRDEFDHKLTPGISAAPLLEDLDETFAHKACDLALTLLRSRAA